MVDIPTVPITEAAEEDNFSVMRLDSLVAHHKLICDELQSVAEGRTPNLLLLLPPGSAKSTYADVVFVPWFMAKYPRRNVILGSYASDIARKQGRRARQLIRSRSFATLFPDLELSAASSAADEWMLSNGGEYMAGGLLSGLTGNRAALGILDDPIKGRDAAESQLIRDKTWDAYIDDFCSRLTPGAPQIMILTRWHQDDPAGRILPENWAGESGTFAGRDGRTWKVICLPAICERSDDPLGRKVGETLWPEWFNHEHWAPFQKNVRTWTSLYQQRPAPEEGTYFQKAWLKSWSERPEHLSIYGTSDFAVSEGKGDYTVHRVWGVDTKGDIYRLTGWRGQTASDEWIERLVDLMAIHKPFTWFGEAGVIQKAIEPMLIRRMRERGVFCNMQWLPSIQDKSTRARGFQARASMGAVHLEPDADTAEFLAFPAGKHDDDVDCASLIGRALDELYPASAPKTEGRRSYAGAGSWMG
jgi:predicted phage terminase large subunit-like protein